MPSEYEKMITGDLYHANDKELSSAREQAQQLCHTYNQINPQDLVQRNALLRQLLGRTRHSFHIESTFLCRYGFNIFLGEKFQAQANCTLIDSAAITIGDYVILSNNVALYTATYPTNPYLRAEGVELAKPITLGNHVWIGANSVILPGVTLGDRVIVGAGSVVTKSFPADVVIAGNPADILYPMTLEENHLTISAQQYAVFIEEEEILLASPEKAIDLKLY